MYTLKVACMRDGLINTQTAGSHGTRLAVLCQEYCFPWHPDTYNQVFNRTHGPRLGNKVMFAVVQYNPTSFLGITWSQRDLCILVAIGANSFLHSHIKIPIQ
jgi:hypothetical protein